MPLPAVLPAGSSKLTWHTLCLPLMLVLLWWFLLLGLYFLTVQREDAYAEELARSQTGTLFASIVETRAWNARHGGVWVREGTGSPPNPWLPEGERFLMAADGGRLVKINPAYMTRQIAESSTLPQASFRISSLTPMRPENGADLWETGALLNFHAGMQEAFALVKEKENHISRYRYMAPLIATESCLTCHTRRAVGDVLGGISVSISADPFHNAAAARKHTTGMAFGLIGFVGTLGIGGATLQISRKREQAEIANRTKSAFLANMSHDMRTPLSGILGMAELLERSATEPRNRYLLSSLRAATESLLDVVDGIMRYALLEADGQPTQARPFSLRAEVEACMAALRPACENKGLTLSLIMESEPQPLPDRFLGDGFRLRQALGNLLGNAVKFTDHGSVTMYVSMEETEHAPAVLHFSVADTGIGIPEAEQDWIFERFEQGTAAKDKPHLSEKTGQSGVGLGLSIARNIAQRFGGDLTLHSTPGEGSTFTLTARFELDLTPSATAATECSMSSSPSQNTPAVPKTGTLVVAEDTPVAALFLDEVLSGAGHSVHMANSGESARHLIQKIRPDMAILDIRMPGMGGLELATEIRQGKVDIRPDLPLLVLTATLTPEHETALRSLKVNGWFLKPVQTDTLLEAVQRTLRTPEESIPPETTILSPASAPQTATPESFQLSAADAALFDCRAALEDLEGNETLLRRLNNLFLLEEVQLRKGLSAAREQLMSTSPSAGTRLAPLHRQAHSLKNSAATLHLMPLHQATAELEAAVAALTVNRTPTKDLLTELNTEERTTVLVPLMVVLSALEEACTVLRKMGYGKN